MNFFRLGLTCWSNDKTRLRRYCRSLWLRALKHKAQLRLFTQRRNKSMCLNHTFLCLRAIRLSSFLFCISFLCLFSVFFFLLLLLFFSLYVSEGRHGMIIKFYITKHINFNLAASIASKDRSGCSLCAGSTAPSFPRSLDRRPGLRA